SGNAPKVAVSTPSDPTEKNSSCMRATTSGRVRTRFSLQPSSASPPKSSGLRSWACMNVPKAPSSTSTRSCIASRNGCTAPLATGEVVPRGSAITTGYVPGAADSPPIPRLLPTCRRADAAKPRTAQRRSCVKVYTRTGDDGTTGLLYGGRTGKDDAGPEAYGAVDEAVSALGLARAETETGSELHDLLVRLQRECFVGGAELPAGPAKPPHLEPGV